MLCNMFFYVVQHIFRISAKRIKCNHSGTIAFFATVGRPIIALFADACRKMHKMQKLAVAASNCLS